MGILDPVKQQARVTSTLYHVGNPLVAGTESSYDIRTTTRQTFILPLASAGVVDMGIAIGHDLTAAGVGVSLLIELFYGWDESEAGGSDSGNSANLFGSVPDSTDMESGARYHFLPEVAASASTANPRYQQFEIPELRGPVQSIKMNVTARSVPDAGTLLFRLVRRY